MLPSSFFNSPTSQDTRTIFPATVVDNNDPDNAWRLRCRINDLTDGEINQSNLPFCQPLLGKGNGSLPKLGDTVLIILGDLSDPLTERYWISRQFSQFQVIENEQGIQNNMKGTVFSDTAFNANISNLPFVSDYFPSSKNKDRTWFLSRYNGHFFFDKNEYMLRVGSYESNDPYKPNRSNTSITHHQYNSELETTQFHAADKIMLYSHKGTTKTNINSIDEDRLRTLFDKMSPIVKSNELIPILKVIINAIQSHTHDYHNRVANSTQSSMLNLKRINLDNIKSENIRVN